MGAVNTVVRRKDGTVVGHNTDLFGFSSMLDRSGLKINGKKVLVLGSGGASMTVQKVLQERSSQVIVISRSGENNYQNLHRHCDAAVIVNCTPVGMYPDNGTAPVELGLFPHLEGVLDLIYNPARTKLLLDAEARGIVAENGLWMLVAQAKESAEWFLNRTLPDSCIERVYKMLRNQMQNIILIGMPGSGKSTVGKQLARITGRPFLDADAQLENATGRRIPDIFATDGEEHFRQLETETLTELGNRSGIILASGGGCVTKERNYPLLHQNGRIVWLQRELSQLPSDGRPLSQITTMEAMYAVRKPLYSQFADISVTNDRTPADVAHQILEKLYGGNP